MTDTRARPRRSWRSIAIPTEHGGWGLTLEPVLLGLLVAPSAAGGFLGVATLLAFTARTPLKVVLVDTWRHRKLDRTNLAAGIAGAELVLLAASVTAAALTAEGPFWIPLAAALPLVSIELWFDMRSRSRRLVPELAGTVGITAAGAAIVLAGGGAATTAAGVWAVLAARGIASVPFVRCQLQRAKGRAVRVARSDLAQLVALAVAVLAWALGTLPVIAVAAVGGLGIVQAVLSRLPPPKAAVVGAQQVVIGLSVVLVSVLAILAV